MSSPTHQIAQNFTHMEINAYEVNTLKLSFVTSLQHL